MKLIDKDALVVEIERRIEGINPLSQRVGVVGCSNTIKHLRGVLSFINSLEVKKVDLEKELNNFIEQQKAFVKDDRVVEYNNGDTFNHIYDLEGIAKYFFELGLKAQKGEEA